MLPREDKVPADLKWLSIILNQDLPRHGMIRVMMEPLVLVMLDLLTMYNMFLMLKTTRLHPLHLVRVVSSLRRRGGERGREVGSR